MYVYVSSILKRGKWNFDNLIILVKKLIYFDENIKTIDQYVKWLPLYQCYIDNNWSREQKPTNDKKVKTRFCSSNFLFLDTSFAATIFALQNHFGFHFDKGKKKKLFFISLFFIFWRRKSEGETFLHTNSLSLLLTLSLSPTQTHLQIHPLTDIHKLAYFLDHSR